MCLSETYLIPDILTDDDKLQISGYYLFRADYPFHMQQRDACINYKMYLPLKIKNIPFLQECINFEIKIKDKACNLTSLYCSPNQSLDDFESFIKNLKLNVDSIVVNCCSWQF